MIEDRPVDAGQKGTDMEDFPYGREIRAIIRGVAADDKALALAYATQLARKLCEDGHPKAAASIDRILAGDFTSEIQAQET